MYTREELTAVSKVNVGDYFYQSSGYKKIVVIFKMFGDEYLIKLQDGDSLICYEDIEVVIKKHFDFKKIFKDL